MRNSGETRMARSLGPAFCPEGLQDSISNGGSTMGQVSPAALSLSNSWLLEFFLMGRGKVARKGRTLGFLEQKYQGGTEQADDYQHPKLI
jgi:hypothetical protein